MVSDLKAQAEALVLFANDVDGLLTCALRPSNVFGPGDTEIIPFVVNQAKSGWAKVCKLLFSSIYVSSIFLLPCLKLCSAIEYNRKPFESLVQVFKYSRANSSLDFMFSCLHLCI